MTFPRRPGHSRVEGFSLAPSLRRPFRLLVFAILVASGLVSLSATGAAVEKSAFVSSAPVLVERPVSTKLDPFLRRLVRDYESRVPLAWALPSEVEKPLIRTEATADGGLAAAVFIRTTDVEKTKADVASLGGYVRVEAGDILVAVVPVMSLETLADRPENTSIETSHFRKLQLDVSRAATKADLVQAGTGLPAPRTGTGVIVGVVDSGIDYTRADFKTSGGTTRIRSIWDISGVAAGGNPHICTQSDINSATCTERDLNGHGTHVTGIAAGAGHLQTGFIGMAPDADIIAAKATRSTTAEGTFADDDIVAAASYIFQQAQAAGKPAVVNMSLGGLEGPLDGTSSFEQALSNLTGAGKILVAAAGNSGTVPVHLAYATQGSSYSTSLETPWTPAPDKSSGYALLWYASGSITVGIAARTTSTQDTGILISPPIGPGQSTGVLDLKDGSGTILAHYQIDASTTNYSSNGAHVAYVMLQPVVSQYFSLYTYGSGSFDAWAVNMEFGTRSDSYWRPADWQKTIGSPATALKVISVGAFTTKMQWTDVTGSPQAFTSWCGPSFPDTLGNIACFSSLGPTRDGRTKPDISAPGHRIASDLSVDSVSNQDIADRMQGGNLLLESGTSQAAPHVTGIVALMLQANPSLTYDTALQVLQNSATKDSFTGSTTSNTWGAGKVNALEAVQVAGGGSPTVCTADATTMCLLGGRYRVTSHWQNQYAGGLVSTLNKTTLTSATGAFWLSDSNSYEYLIRINTATNNGRAWIAIPTFTDVEFWITVEDLTNGQSQTYHSLPGNRTLIYDPYFFVYP